MLHATTSMVSRSLPAESSSDQQSFPSADNLPTVIETKTVQYCIPVVTPSYSALSVGVINEAFKLYSCSMETSVIHNPVVRLDSGN